MFCPHCGSNEPDGTQFCSNCGQPIQQPAQASSQQDYGTQISPAPVNASQGYGMPSTPPVGQGFGPLRTDRDIIMYILLSLVTCDIYAYWYIYQMAQDANAICAGDNESTPGLGIFILLSLVTCGIYSYYWLYKLANRLQANAPRYGINLQEGGSDVLLWLVLGCFTCGICAFIGMNIIMKNMNTLSIAYNSVNGYA